MSEVITLFLGAVEYATSPVDVSFHIDQKITDEQSANKKKKTDRKREGYD